MSVSESGTHGKRGPMMERSKEDRRLLKNNESLIKELDRSKKVIVLLEQQLEDLLLDRRNPPSPDSLWALAKKPELPMEARVEATISALLRTEDDALFFRLEMLFAPRLQVAACEALLSRDYKEGSSLTPEQRKSVSGLALTWMENTQDHQPFWEKSAFLRAFANVALMLDPHNVLSIIVDMTLKETKDQDNPLGATFAGVLKRGVSQKWITRDDIRTVMKDRDTALVNLFLICL